MTGVDRFLDEAVALALENVRQGGRPFGAVVVKDGKVVARAVNRMDRDNDPTAHAELLALRAAGAALGSTRLDGCVVYASGQPCPMCLAAMRMAGVAEIAFAYSNEQAEPYGLSTAAVAAELAKPLGQQQGLSIRHCPRPDEDDLYRAWQDHAGSISSEMDMQVPAYPPAPGRHWALLALVVLIGLNLRPFLTAPGPVLGDIAADTGMGYGGLALLTLLPMLLMGVGAFLAPALQAVVGTRRGMLVALLALTLGSALRLVPGGLPLIATAVVCGAGVAFIQAAFPGIIKARFPTKVSAVTGLYSAMIMGGGALGAQLTPVLAGIAGDWRTALAWLALPAAVALVAARRVLEELGTAAPDAALTAALLRRPRTWLLMAAFGLVNGGYSSMVAWLAPYYQAQGWAAAESGSLVAVMAVFQAASALVMPMLAARSRDRRPWLIATLAMQAIGFAGLALQPAAAPAVWIAICGAGLGGSFSLALVTALDHLPRPEQAGALAALMQGGGFLIAALAPLATALLHGWTGGFAGGWLLHLGFVAITVALYLRLDPARYAEAIDLAGCSGIHLECGAVRAGGQSPA